MSVISEAFEALRDYPVTESVEANDYKAAQNEAEKAINSLRNSKLKFVRSQPGFLTYKTGEIGMIKHDSFFGETIKEQREIDEALKKASNRSKKFKFKRGSSFGVKVAKGALSGAAMGLLGAPGMAAGFSASTDLMDDRTIFVDYK